MWEDLTVALCGVGFALAVAIVLIELHAVFSPLDAWMRAGAPMSPGGRRAFRMRVAHPRWAGWVRHRGRAA